MCLIVPSLWLSIVPVEGKSHSESLVGAEKRARQRRISLQIKWWAAVRGASSRGHLL